MGPVSFAVWAYIIAHAKPPGEVEANPRVVAALIGCSPGEVDKVLQQFCQPDDLSRNQHHDGRRLLPLGPFTYEVTGWEKYQQIRNEEARREQNRQAQQRLRQKRRNDDSQQSSAGRQQRSAESAHVDVDADTSRRGRSVKRPESVSEAVWQDWLAHRRRKRSTVTATVLKTFQREAEKASMTLEEAISTSIAQGWAGFRAEWIASSRDDHRRAARHIPNLPLGSASCNCPNCVAYRAKNQSTN